MRARADDARYLRVIGAFYYAWYATRCVCGGGGGGGGGIVKQYGRPKALAVGHSVRVVLIIRS